MICLATIRHFRSHTTSPINTNCDAVLEGHCCPVRWKLLIITSLIAALLSAAGMRALAYWLMGSAARAEAAPHPATIFAVVLVPLLLAALASVFVYRHTARRRKLQAALTVLFALVLTVASLYTSRMFLNL